MKGMKVSQTFFATTQRIGWGRRAPLHSITLVPWAHRLSLKQCTDLGTLLNNSLEDILYFCIVGTYGILLRLQYTILLLVLLPYNLVKATIIAMISELTFTKSQRFCAHVFTLAWCCWVLRALMSDITDDPWCAIFSQKIVNNFSSFLTAIVKFASFKV